VFSEDDESIRSLMGHVLAVEEWDEALKDGMVMVAQSPTRIFTVWHDMSTSMVLCFILKAYSLNV
jgi:hypothetical protein